MCRHIMRRIVHAAWPPPTVLHVLSLLVELQRHVSAAQWRQVQQRLLKDLHADDPVLNSDLPGMVRCCLKMISVEVAAARSNSSSGDGATGKHQPRADDFEAQKRLALERKLAKLEEKQRKKRAKQRGSMNKKNKGRTDLEDEGEECDEAGELLLADEEADQDREGSSRAGRPRTASARALSDGWVDVLRTLFARAPRESFANACLVARIGMRKAVAVCLCVVERLERAIGGRSPGSGVGTGLFAHLPPAPKRRAITSRTIDSSSATTTTTTPSSSAQLSDCSHHHPTWRDIVLLLAVISCHHDVIGSGTALFAALVQAGVEGKGLAATTRAGTKVVSVVRSFCRRWGNLPA
jgi:hypothetical protein